MDAAADATPSGAWASMRGYFTPATLFLLLNLVIGTIAVTSRSHQLRRRRNREHQEPLDDPHQQQEQHEYHHYYYQQPQHQYVHATPPPPPAPLARTSSVLDRLRSISLYRFRSGDFPPEYGEPAVAEGADRDAFAFAPVEDETTKQAAARYARSGSEPAPAPAREEEEKRAPPTVKKSDAEVVGKTRVARAPVTRVVVEAVAADARAEEFIASLRQEEPSSPTKTEHHHQEEYVPPPAPMRAPPLSRTSSVLDRLRSLGLYSFLAAEATPATDGFAVASTGHEKQVHAHYYDRSRSEPAREQCNKEKKQAASEAEMAKSSSTTARKAAAPRLVEEDCVDARAEAFIDSFRKKQVRRDEDDEQQERVVSSHPAPLLARTSSVLDRLRSFSLYLRSGADPVPDRNPVKASAADEKEQSEATREQLGKKKKQGARMSKTSSEEAAARNVAGEEEEAAPAEECVDARADDFINRFRQQLHLQRLNSLLNYREVLNRGGSKQQ